MKIAEGHITLVQEGRFRLTTSEGQSILLTLAHDTASTGNDLLDWYEKGTHVIVEFTGDEGFESATAHAVGIAV
ncbi:MAG TPA: hypothetical protein VGJ94_06205 [Syntrophorhabdaceae bacterium]